MKAQRIVDALLGDEDPKAYVGTSEDITRQRVLAALDDAGVTPDTVDGVEVYAMIDNGEYQERVEKGTEANRWGVSIHTRTARWLIDFDDYNSPQDAVQAANAVYKALTTLQPRATIHFIDEVS